MKKQNQIKPWEILPIHWFLFLKIAKYSTYILSVLILLALFMCVSCKKTSSASKVAGPNNQTNSSPSQNDTALIHTWIADSIKTDGQPTIITGGTVSDTLKIASTQWQQYLWNSGFNTGFSASWTSAGDSAIAGAQHSKYSITGNKLHLYAKAAPANCQYWFRRK